MLDAVRAYFFVFGAITIAGGVLGWVKARSSASIIAGGVFGGLLLLAAWLCGRGDRIGPAVALFVSLMLAGRFTKAFRQNGKVMPGGVMALLGLVGVAVALVGLAR